MKLPPGRCACREPTVRWCTRHGKPRIEGMGGELKPVVLYHEATSARVGEVVWLFGIKDHPSLADRPVTDSVGIRTSPVVRVGDDGEFETLNTIYRKFPNVPIPEAEAMTHE